MSDLVHKSREDSRIESLEDNVKNARVSVLAVCIGLLTLAPVVLAHHGTANYDTSSKITVKGVVTGFEFVNPHVQISWDAKDSSGTMQKWQGELTSPNHLMRVGWTKTSIKPGDEITINGFGTKSGSHEIWIQKVTMANSEDLPTGGGY
jgi:hypothetical protein